jgi:hypothetical protein
MLIAHTPPWHLWGGSQIVHTETDGTLSAPIEATQQLCKINYGRPETWNFFFAAKIVGGFRDPVQNGLLRVRFELILGLGRNATIIAGEGIGFENYIFDWPVGPVTSQVPRHLIYSTSVYAPNRTTDTAPAVQRDNLVTSFVAQDIQCQAIVVNQNLYAGFVDIEVAAYFAPSTHVRPDWMLFDKDLSEQFPGGEIGGR